MENRRTVLVVLVLALICGAVGWWLYSFTRETVYTNDAQVMGFETLVSNDLETLRITALYVDEGDMVEEGELLAELDRTLIEPQFEQSKAQVSLQEAQIRYAEAHLAKVYDDYERAKKGFSEQIITAQQWDHASKNLQMAKASLEVAQAEYEVNRKHTAYLESQLRHTYIHAPMSGQITKRWQWTGNVIRPGQSIFSLYDLEDVWVLAILQETDLAGVSIGDPVKIWVDAYPGATFEGTVFAIQGSAASQFSLIPPDNATGNYTKVEQRIPIKISIDKTNLPDDLESLYLFPGMSAEVRIYTR